MNATVLPAAQYGDPTLGEVRVMPTEIADRRVLLRLRSLAVLTADEARAMGGDLIRRANHIDPTGGEP